MIEILPNWLYEKISNNYLLEFITEIRLRINKPISVCYKGRYEILKERNGYENMTICANKDLISYILTVATKQSFYAYNNQIKHGFITTDSGFRIGICGEAVMDNGKVTTIKNVSSINIRISHKVPRCSEKILDYICNSSLPHNSLIISPPGAGKTTFIRDLASMLSSRKKICNILVVDERFEIAGNNNTSDLIDGDGIDIISGAPKHYAFREGIKSMNPSVIIADEISEEEDFAEIMEAVRSGVRVVATAHASGIADLKSRPSFEKILQAKVFSRIIVLSKRNGIGTIEGVFDENLRGIYIPIEL